MSTEIAWTRVTFPNKITSLLFLFCFSLSFLMAQNASSTVSKVYKQLQKAKDYTADAQVTVSLPFIKIAPIHAKIFLKQPDKFRVQSKSIAIVPRQGFDQLHKILSDTTAFIAISQGTEMVEKVPAQLINLIPLRDTADLVLAKLWVDPTRNLVLKSLLTTKSNGTILTEYRYGQYAGYGLPDALLFTVDIKKFKIPKSIAADINTNTKKEMGPEKETKKGKIRIELSNYLINKGIPDALFKK